MIRRPPRSTLSSSSAASDVYKRQHKGGPVCAGTCLNNQIGRVRNCCQIIITGSFFNFFKQGFHTGLQGLIVTHCLVQIGLNDLKAPFVDRQRTLNSFLERYSREGFDASLNGRPNEISTSGAC
eukprot:TRINITY_DN63199_c0_g1_i1.p2 TRINITY_DN63199_c0_g1~~TRINITY_DN63199_c0_g1_i1.p2  ORF type:complete len:124 (-),score=16.62 TRINITY_DN63199_c0_g1_i1:233-604(-)